MLLSGKWLRRDVDVAYGSFRRVRYIVHKGRGDEIVQSMVAGTVCVGEAEWSMRLV